MLAHVLAEPHWPDTSGQLPVGGVGVVGVVGAVGVAEWVL